MTECLQHKELVAFQQNEINLKSNQNTTFHLEKCKICSQEYSNIKKHLDLYSKIQLPEFTSNQLDWSKIKDTIKLEATINSKPHFFFQATAATILLLGILTYFFIPQNNSLLLTQGSLHKKNNTLNIINQSYAWQNNNLFHTKNTHASFTIGQISCSLSTQTQIQIINSSKIRLIKGNIYVSVIPGASLQILTSNAQANVLGTSFLVNKMNEFTKIIVYHGTVKFSNLHKKNVVLKKGQNSDSKSMKLSFHTEKIPSWVNQPILVDIQDKDSYIAISIQNVTSNLLYLNRYSTTPNFLFHVKHVESNTQFQTPAFTKKQQSFHIPPGKVKTVKILKSHIFKQRGLHKITLIFQAKIQTENTWSGIIRSSAITFKY